tara:strand:+ start:349 stop:516 length:168 start_codon:yes stop_codon:yes gene_type:complete
VQFLAHITPLLLLGWPSQIKLIYPLSSHWFGVEHVFHVGEALSTMVLLLLGGLLK